MGKIYLYKGVYNEFDTYDACGKLRDILPECDFNRNLALKKGSKLDPDYEVKTDDIIFIRAIPGALTAAAATAIGIGIIAAGGAFVAGGIIGQAISIKTEKKTKEAQEKAQRDADNLAAKITQLPYIKGASNKSALGNSIQYLLGEMLNTPYKLTDGFYTVENDASQETGDGAKIFYNVILSLGYGNQRIKNIKIGDNAIISTADTDGLTEGVHDATSAQPLDSSSTYYDASNLIEIAQKGTEFETALFNKKVNCVQDGAEIKHDYGEAAEAVIRDLPDYTQKVELCIQFNGLRQYNSDSEAWEERSVKINPYWSNDGGQTWNLITFNDAENVITANTNHTIRYIAFKEFNTVEAYGKSIKIKIERETPHKESNSTEDAYLLYYQTFAYDNAKSSTSELVSCAPLEEEFVNKTTRIAVRLISNDNTKDNLDEISALTCSLARTWNGSAWSTDKSATRNPAAIILEILTSETHTHSKFDDEEIELESLGALYEYCEDNDFYADALLTAAQKKSDIISGILNTVNATIFTNSEGKLEFAIDKEEVNPIALLNGDDVKEITYTKSLARKADGAKVTFTNRENWLVDTLYQMRDPTKTRTADDTLTEYNLDYITTAAHAQKYALRKLKELYLRPRTFTVKVGREGDYYPLYKKVLLQVTNFRQGIRSSYIESADATGFKIADYVNYDPTKKYGAIIHAMSDSGSRILYKEITASAAGDTRSFTYAEPITDGGILPEFNNVVSIGYLTDTGAFTTVTNEMKIKAIEPDGTDGYTLTLEDYNASIYDYSGIIEYKSNLTRPAAKVGSPTTTQPLIIPAAAEAASYRGKVSQWADMPITAEKDDFILITKGFTKNLPLCVNGGNLLLSTGSYLYIAREFLKGYIYKYNGAIWEIISDRDDWRYIIAANDLYNSASSISPAFNSAISDKAEEVAEVIAEEKVSEEVKTKTASYTPKYCGTVDALPETTTAYNMGDFVLLKTDGVTYSLGTNGFTADTGAVLTEHLAACINDLLSLADSLSTSPAFITNLVACNAFINNLFAKKITLLSGGSIQSNNYSEGKNGFKIDGSTGNAEFSAGKFRGVLGSIVEVETSSERQDDGSYILTGVIDHNNFVNDAIYKIEIIHKIEKVYVTTMGEHTYYKQMFIGEFIYHYYYNLLSSVKYVNLFPVKVTDGLTVETADSTLKATITYTQGQTAGDLLCFNMTRLS